MNRPIGDDSRLPVEKVQRLIAYIENLGLDPVAVARNVGLDLTEILGARPGHSIPRLYYALIYKETVVELQNDGKLVPWAAGLGSDAFRMMCYCIISCRTLGDVLERAQEFDTLLYPVTGHQISIRKCKGELARLEYSIEELAKRSAFAPRRWSLEECDSVAKSSGLETWYGLCGWLIGRGIEVSAASISGVELSPEYRERMNGLFGCKVAFGAATTMLEFPDPFLGMPIVHDSRSLDDFLETGPHQLWSPENRVVSTSAAIRSLLGTDFRSGIPSFEDMAKRMHMSSSTLRRHLLAEGTSYQKIKDESRHELAIELLCFSETKIADISDRVGFADTSSFVRSFRAWTGVTPKAYREHAKPMQHENSPAQ